MCVRTRCDSRGGLPSLASIDRAGPASCLGGRFGVFRTGLVSLTHTFYYVRFGDTKQYEELSESITDVVFIKIDVDENPDTAAKVRVDWVGRRRRRLA
jgi:hypothetical protein